MYFRQRLMPILHRPAIVVAPPSGDPDLYTNLSAYWELEEASGTRADSHTGGLDLTDNNTVTQTTGIQGNAAFFTNGDNEYLSRAATSALNYSGDFTIAFWVNPGSGVIGAGHDLLSKMFGGFDDEFRVANFDGNQLGFTCFNSGGTGFKANAPDNFSDGSWQFIINRFTASSGEVACRRNAGSWGTATLTGSMAAGTAPMQIGGVGFKWAGGIDEFGFWKEALSDEKCEWLYNSGAGRTYAEIAATAP